MAALDFFTNLFRPRWRNTDPDVRADAVRQMDEYDAATLAKIAKSDSDVRVRRIAVKKLVDTDVLADLAGSESDEILRKSISDKLSETLIANAVAATEPERAKHAVSQLTNQRALAEVARQAALEPIRLAAVGKITDAKALLDVAKNAADNGTRLVALRRITESAQLRELAIHEPAKEFGLAALERISDDEDLEAVFRRAKNKTVREAARERLGLAPPSDRPTSKARAIAAKQEGPAPEASPEARRRARQVQLCATVEKLGGSEDFVSGAASIAEAEREWRASGSAESDLEKRFERAVKRFNDRRSVHDEALAAQERALRAEQEALAKRLAIAATVENLDGEEVAKRLEEARAAWKVAGSVPAAQHGELEQRFARAVEAVQKRQEQGKTRAAIRGRQEALALEIDGLTVPEKMAVAEKKLPGMQKEWRDLAAAGAPDEALEKRFHAAAEQISARGTAVRAEEKAREDAEHAHNLARLQELCAQVEALGETEDRKAAEQTLKVAQSAFESTGAVGKEQQLEIKKRFQAARDKLMGRLQDLRDAEHWKRWANVPRLEALVAKVEALRDNTEIELKRLGPALKTLQAEWKTVGAAPKEKSEALWARFKEAGDHVFKRMGEHLEKVDENRGENLIKKEELIVQVTALAGVPVAEMNFKDTAEKIKALQEQWKALGPVPKEQADDVWKRFREACDKFFGLRKEHLGKVGEERGENLKKKEDLVAQASKLASSIGPSVNWKETADKLKALQEEWKTVGPVNKEQADEVWKRFREACDKFFERRKEHFGKLDDERAANLKKKEDLIVQIEAIVANPEMLEGKQRDSAMKQVKDLQAIWKRTGPAPKEQADAIWKRFREACDKFFKPADEQESHQPEETAAAPEAAKDEQGLGISRFTNRLPLEGLLQKGAGEAPATTADPVVTATADEPTRKVVAAAAAPVESVPDPVAESVAEPVAESVAEPVAEPAAEPAAASAEAEPKT